MKKNSSIELLRIVAMFFVIFNHTWNLGWTLFATYPVGSFQFFFYMPIAVFCKFSVPVYFMISGALLLNKEETAQRLKKRIIRMTIVLLSISLLYYVYDALIGNIQIKSINEMFVDFFCKILSGSTKYNLGFLYSYIAFLLILPFLRILAKNIKNNNIYIYIHHFFCADDICPNDRTVAFYRD